jgi:hypothetical protein
MKVSRDGSEDSMSPDELKDFMYKLEAFVESLTGKERALLLQVLTRAGSDALEDVEAHADGPITLGAAALAVYERYVEDVPIV